VSVSHLFACVSLGSLAVLTSTWRPQRYNDGQIHGERGALLRGGSQRLAGGEALLGCPGSGTQPTFLDLLAAFATE